MGTKEINDAIAAFCGFELNARGYAISRMSDRSLLWPPDLLANFTDDIAASMLMEDELTKRGLSEPYAIALARRIGYDNTPAAVPAVPRDPAGASRGMLYRD